MPATKTHPNRAVFWFLLVLTPLLGLGTRAYAHRLPALWATYAPDALWALLVFVLAVLLLPRTPIWKTALIALCFSYAVEISQLYQAPWINAIRATHLGALILGHGFLWSDLVCYAVGIAFGMIIALRFNET